MTTSDTEDAIGIAAAIRPLATRKELGESEKRLNAASKTLWSKMLEEIQDRDERMRDELKADLEQAVERNRLFSPEFSAGVESFVIHLLSWVALSMFCIGIVVTINFLFL